jgi:subtilisin family serine protease
VRDGRGLRPLVATVLAAGLSTVLTAPAGAAPRVSVGFASDAALHSLPARIVRVVPALHVAEIETRIAPRRLRASPGISFATAVRARRAAAEPALAESPLLGRPYEWQYAATRADRVPGWVQRAAAAVTIGIVDTGADVTAPDLAGKAVSVSVGAGDDARDTNGHGTFVAALAGGSVTNGDGIAGFGGDARLLVVRAGRGDGTFTDVDEAAAIAYAVDHGARIVNLSIGGSSTSATERRAIDYAVSHGALVVAAAGNEYERGNPVEYPAALLRGRGLAVAASTPTGVRAPFSSTGPYVAVAAPGAAVFSAVAPASSPLAYPRVRLPGATGLYGFGSGTSYAAPEVAGAAALVWAANPLLTAAQVEDIVEETADGHGGWTPELGHGVLDVAQAVARAAGTAGPTRTTEARRPRTASD